MTPGASTGLDVVWTRKWLELWKPASGQLLSTLRLEWSSLNCSGGMEFICLTWAWIFFFKTFKGAFKLNSLVGIAGIGHIRSPYAMVGSVKVIGKTEILRGTQGEWPPYSLTESEYHVFKVCGGIKGGPGWKHTLGHEAQLCRGSGAIRRVGGQKMCYEFGSMLWKQELRLELAVQ